MLNIRPLSNHIFLETTVDNKITKSGIYIPETTEKERPVVGRVVAAGPGKMNDRGEVVPMSVKVGDMVLFKKYGMDDIEFDNQKYLVGSEDDVLAII